MGSWELVFPVAGPGSPQEARQPLYARIAQAVAADIRRGRLQPGQKLPGSRVLARQLSVHRNTVLAAYDELIAEQWVVARPARGVFVSSEIPDPMPQQTSRAAARTTVSASRRPNSPAGVPFSLAPTAAPDTPLIRPAHVRGTLVMAGGIPDVRLFPAVHYARAYRRTLLRASARKLLGYGDPHGDANLRRELARMLSATRGLAADPAQIVITRGSQMALYLVARALLSPGDTVAVEEPGYPPAWNAFRAAGAHLQPLRVDRSGACLDTLLAHAGPTASGGRRTRIRAIYLTPHHQYPTTVMLAPGRRLALLDYARRQRVAVIEDDYDHEFHYEGRPVLPVASADTAGSVIYIGTLSKVLAPALRIGYIVAPVPLVERIAQLRSIMDMQGDQLAEAAAAEMLEDGEVARHIRRTRKIYQARRDALLGQIARRLAGALTVRRPSGGMALWARVDSGIDVDAWHRRAADHRVAFQPGRRFTIDGRALPHLRLGFGLLNEGEISEAVRRMACAL